MSHTLPVSSLDFDSIRQSLKTHLQSQSIFADYDFDGSNIGVLLDLLAYNTYINAYYLHMAASETFLDTAMLRPTVLSHTKELNYLPRSAVGASAVVTLTVNTGANTPGSLTVPKYYKVNGRVANSTYAFYTTNTHTITPNSSGGYTSSNVTITEGTLVVERSTVTANTANTSQRFIISNANVDLSTLTITIVNSNNDLTNTDYTLATTLYGLSNTSNVYFLQAGVDDKYEVVFGNDVTGRSLAVGNIVEFRYLVSHGAAINGARTFTPAQSIDGYSTVTATTVSRAAGGAAVESIASIKFNAPRHFATQERAITRDDYRSLILRQFPTFSDVNVYGGELVEPAQYGRVIISITTNQGNAPADFVKENVIQYISQRNSLAIEPVIEDPSFFNIKINTSVRYDTTVTTKGTSDIEALVRASINTFNTDNLNRFDTTFEYSRFLAAIDESDPSILSNQTSASMIKTLVPVPGVETTYSFSFRNQLHEGRSSTSETSVITSTAFVYNGIDAKIKDDGLGTLYVYSDSIDVEDVILNSNIGSVNYTTGAIVITSLTVDSYTGNGIDIIATPLNDDIVASLNQIFNIANNDVTVSVVGVTN